MSMLLQVGVGCLGAMVGSFLNVCIYRIPRDRSVWAPRSSCPQCGVMIRWYDNIPVWSFCWLGTRCRDCRRPISPRYPLVELLTAGLFLLCLHIFGPTWEAVGSAVLGSTLIGLTFIDLEHQILPNVMTYPLAAVGVGFSLLTQRLRLSEALLGVVSGAGFLYIIAFMSLMLLKQEGMGMGDVKLAGALGAWFGTKLVMVCLFLAFFLGAFVGIALMAAKIKGRRDFIPFGPFIAAGAVFVMFASEWIQEQLWVVFEGM